MSSEVEQLDALATDYVDRLRRGEAPDTAEYVRAHPDLAADIISLFPLLGAMEGLREDPEPAPLPGGGTLGPYRITREVGRGGMGVVYEAEQTELGRRVALKLLPPQQTYDPRFLERFRLEAQAAARLEHPHIVPVIGYGQHEDMHYYSMQFIEGRGLDELVEEVRTEFDDEGSGTTNAAAARGWFERVARIGQQAAGALAHAHAHGVLHRDIKPSNILIDANDHVWIADFGLCRQEGSDGVTATGDVLGTFRYMPPERFQGVSNVRGDVYGIGITLYELLTRRRAYEEENPAALASTITSQEAKRPRAHDPRIPPDLETIVRKAMAHDPAHRYATAGELTRDLEAFLDGRPISARAPTLTYLLRKTVARHKSLAVTGLIALLALIGTFTWYVFDLKEKEAEARHQESLARASAAEAEHQKAQARQREYAASIAAAEAAIRVRDPRRASALLDEAPEEYRKWEWRHLKAELDQDVRAFQSPGEGVYSIAHHPSGAVFAYAAGSWVYVVDDRSGRVIRKLRTDAKATRVCWHPKGHRIFVGTKQHIEYWSYPELERTYRGVRVGEYVNIAYAPHANWVVCALTKGLIVAHDAETGIVRSNKQLPARALSVDCAPDEAQDRVVIGVGNGTVQVYDLPGWKERWTHRVTQIGAHLAAFLGKGRVACSTVEGFVRIWSVETGEELHSYALGTVGGHIARDPTGKRLIVVSLGRVHVFDAATGLPIQVLSGDTVTYTANVHPDGRRIVVGARSGALREWYLGHRGNPNVLTRHMSDALNVDIHPDDRRIVTCGFGGIVRVWDLDTGELVRGLFGHGATVACVRFSPDGSHIASADDSGEVLIWETRGYTLLRRWAAAPNVVAGVEWLDDQRIATVARHGTLAVWDSRTGGRLDEAYIEGGAPFSSLAVNPDRTHLACGDHSGRLRIYSVEDGLTLQHEVAAHVSTVSDLAFDPAGTRLATVSFDQRLCIWDVASGKLLIGTERNPKLAWLAEGKRSVGWTPDGGRVVTGSLSGSVQLWDPTDLRLYSHLRTDWTWVCGIRFTKDATRLVTPLSTGSVMIWDARPKRERIPMLERTAQLATAAAPIVDAVRDRLWDDDAVRAGLAEHAAAAPEVLESALREIHRLRCDREGLIARLWADLTPRDTSSERITVALALTLGLWRSSRHVDDRDARCDSLRALAYLRAGLPQHALVIFREIARKHKTSDPGLYAVDLACAAVAHAALGNKNSTRRRLARLDELLNGDPSLTSPLVKSLREEAVGLIR